MPVKSPFDVPKLQSELQKMAFVRWGPSRRSKTKCAGAMTDCSNHGFSLASFSLWQSTPGGMPAGFPHVCHACRPGPEMPRTDETPEEPVEKLTGAGARVRPGDQERVETNRARWEPSTWLLSAGDAPFRSCLTLAHPRAHLRGFVLQPLTEIARTLVLPGQILSIRQLLETLDSSKDCCGSLRRSGKSWALPPS